MRGEDGFGFVIALDSNLRSHYSNESTLKNVNFRRRNSCGFLTTQVFKIYQGARNPSMIHVEFKK